jgi:hypothetical protein
MNVVMITTKKICDFSLELKALNLIATNYPTIGHVLQKAKGWWE